MLFVRFWVFGLLCYCAVTTPLRGGNWYVAREATGLNNGTSWSDAWQTFSAINWSRIQAGDTLLISGGPAGGTNLYYGNLSDLSGSPNHGASGNPITIRVGSEAGRDGKVKIVGCIFISRDYWTIEGRKSTNNPPGNVLDTYYVGTNCNIEVYNTNTIDQLGWAVRVYGTGKKVYGIHVSGTTYYDDGAFRYEDGGAGHPVGNGAEIAYNWVSSADGYGVSVPAAFWVANTFGQLAVHHNLIENVGDNFMQIGAHSDFYKNVCRNQHVILPNGVRSIGGHPDAVQYVNAYSRVWNNIFYNHLGSRFYIEANDTLNHNILAYNNLWYSEPEWWNLGYSNRYSGVWETNSPDQGPGTGFDITGHDGAPNTLCNLSNIFIFNNTTVQRGTVAKPNPSAFVWGNGTIEVPRDTNSWVKNFWFVNNNIVAISNTAPLIEISTNLDLNNGYNGWAYSESEVHVDFNSVNGASGAGRGIVYGKKGSHTVGLAPYTNMTEFANGTAYKSNNNNTAVYVDAARYDYRPKIGDQALIGRGTNLAALLAAIAPECTKDILGRDRGSVWDIGAYQHDPFAGTNVPPSITGQPQSATNGVGSTVAFSVSAGGSSPLSYQWRFNGINSPGANLSTLTKSNIQFNDAGNYDVVVANAAGSITSGVAVLTVTNVPSGTIAPTITSQPQSVTYGVGSTVAFSVTASGSAPLAYQWRFNGADISGATGTGYTKSNIQLSDAGSYNVVVANAAGTVTSATAVLTVTNSLPTGSYFYVATTGNNSYSTTQARSPATPWRTIQYAVNMAQPGDTILVSPGTYNEYVETARSGTKSSRITIRAYPPNDPNNPVISYQFRVKHQYITIEGFRLRKATGLNKAMVRIEPGGASYNGSDCIVTNNTICDGVMLLTKTASFGSNYVQITDAYEGTDFNTAGFVSGMQVFMGSDSWYRYTNIGPGLTVQSTSADGKRMYFTTTLKPDSGTNYWACIVAGVSGPNSWYGVLVDTPNSGYPGATNIVIANNIFSNLIGVAIGLGPGQSNIITGNVITRLHGGYAFDVQSSNTEIAYNTIRDSTNIIWWTPYEMANIPHPDGSQYYDWQCNLTTSGTGTSTTNVNFHHNWLQSCDNAGGEFNYTANNGNWNVHHNVYIGFQGHLSGSMNYLTFAYNTFYRMAYDQEGSTTIGLGAILSQAAMTNLTVSSNVFVNCGSHRYLSAEVPYALTSVTNGAFQANYSVSAETMGWSNTPAVVGAFGAGDPLFVNASDPLGPDGLAFTEDDGLRPMPNSPLAALGLGALQPLAVGKPIAHFTAQLANPGWKDKTGTNFSPAYFALKPHERSGVMRPWNTPEALGDAPVMVTFDASKSLDGFSTSNTAITSYFWQFSDGGTASGPRVSHTFPTAGTKTVTLWITNTSGAFASYSNRYRTLGGTNTPVPPQPPSSLRVVSTGP